MAVEPMRIKLWVNGANAMNAPTYIFESAQIMSADYIAESDPSMRTLPIGEFSCKIWDKSLNLDPLDPDSLTYTIKRGDIIVPQKMNSGVIPENNGNIGVYYVDEWETDSNQNTITINAIDPIGWLESRAIPPIGSGAGDGFSYTMFRKYVSESEFISDSYVYANAAFSTSDQNGREFLLKCLQVIGTPGLATHNLNTYPSSSAVRSGLGWMLWSPATVDSNWRFDLNFDKMQNLNIKKRQTPKRVTCKYSARSGTIFEEKSLTVNLTTQPQEIVLGEYCTGYNSVPSGVTIQTINQWQSNPFNYAIHRMWATSARQVTLTPITMPVVETSESIDYANSTSDDTALYDFTFMEINETRATAPYRNVFNISDFSTRLWDQCFQFDYECTFSVYAEGYGGVASANKTQYAYTGTPGRIQVSDTKQMVGYITKVEGNLASDRLDITFIGKLI